MEPSSLKEYLETLLAERSDRLMGGVIKHFGSDLCPSDLCYKEVMPAGNMQQPPQEQPAAAPQGSCISDPQPTAAPIYQSCTAEAYQNYAFNALKNLANMFNNAEPQAAAGQNPSCVEPAQDAPCANQMMQTENMLSPAASCQTMPAAAYQSMPDVSVMQPTEVMQVNLLISQQLERMEHMLREMYITNQELFKSIITYCREHTED